MPEPRVNSSATTSRAVQLEAFGGPEVLRLREVPAPQAGAGQIRVRVTAAGLNPMDWIMTSDAETAARFGLRLPCGFGTDYAGVVDQVGDGVTEFAVGDRVFGGALSRAVADYVVIDAAGTLAAGGDAHHTPDGVDDRTAAVLTIGGCTAAALAIVKPGPGDTLLIGGAGGGVGVFAVQLARLAGARDRHGIGDVGRCAACPRGRAGRLWRQPGRPGPRPGSRRRHGGHRPVRDGDGAGGTRTWRPGRAHRHHRCTGRRHRSGKRRERRPGRHRGDRSPGRGGPAPCAHRGKLPGRADPRRGRASSRPARTRQGRRRPLVGHLPRS